MLTTFLSGTVAGGDPGRIGNNHPTMSPWNAYPAADGWVLVCGGSNDMWRRICGVIGRTELVDHERFRSATQRVQNNAEVDAAVAAWTRQHSVAGCIASFGAAGISVGPVNPVSALSTDESLQYRGAVQRLRDPCTDRPIMLQIGRAHV